MTHLVLMSGSLRAGSTNTAALALAASLAAAPAATHDLLDGLGDLPLYTPDRDAAGAEIAPEVTRLRERVDAADAVLISTPEYAGAPPAVLKNALEWLIGSASLYDTPVGWLNVSGPAAPAGGANAYASLELVLRYSAAVIVPAACVRAPLERRMIGADGDIADEVTRGLVGAAVAALLASVPAASS